MATKTISIELDVYETLRSLKRSSRESFSQVLRRARWDSEISTGASILDFYKNKAVGNSLLGKDSIVSLEDFQNSDLPAKDKWRTS